MKKVVEWLMLLSFCYVHVSCWDNDDFELFDLVEEINANFYEVYGIDQSATTSEVRKAYRRLSLSHHPDKSNEENAEEKFRQIAAIYEILKDGKKRERYDQVLVEGLPDWRQPVFYFRKARKMGLFELAIVLTIIITIGQYFVAWGIYIERRLVVEELLTTKKKKEKKKKKLAAAESDTVDEEEELKSIPTPQILDLWPFQLSVLIFSTAYNLPETIKSFQEERKRRKKEEEEERARILLEQETEPEENSRKPKKRSPLDLPEYTGEMYATMTSSVSSVRQSDNSDIDSKVNNSKKGSWSDEELVLLSKAVNKFPGGTHQRWEKIAEMVGRSVTEVTVKAKETKGSYSMTLSSSVQSSGFGHTKPVTSLAISDTIITQNIPDVGNDDIDDSVDNDGHLDPQVRKRNRPIKTEKTAESSLLTSEVPSNSKGKSKTVSIPKTAVGVPAGADGGDKGQALATWTQNQQTIFEWALKQYPKGTDRRWDRVAEHIPGKTKEDCIIRFKVLADLISKKKKTELEGKGS